MKIAKLEAFPNSGLSLIKAYKSPGIFQLNFINFIKNCATNKKKQLLDTYPETMLSTIYLNANI